jgi:hypothetical protein
MSRMGEQYGWEWIARGYCAGRFREGRARGQERVVGRFAACASVGVAEEVIVLMGRLIYWHWRAWPQPASLAVGP